MAALAPFLPLWNASAATVASPRRLLLVYTPHGHYLPKWLPLGTPDAFTLNKSMEPLNPLRAKVNVLAGVGMKGYFHQNGGGQLWTGCQIPNGADGSEPSALPTGPSIDQAVAQAVGMVTRYPSLEFGVSAGGAYGLLSRTIFAGRPVQAVEPLQSPQAAFARLFNQPDSRKLQESKSVLDVVAQELGDINGRIGRADAYKLDQHLTSVRALEKRLGAQVAACAGPQLDNDPMTMVASQQPAQLAAFNDIIASAFACDLTRVASLQFEKCGNDGDTYTWAGCRAGHHELTHAPQGDTTDAQGNPVASIADSVNGQLAATDAWYCRMFAHLLGRLDAIDEGDGTSLLDNTLVVWGTELAHCFTHETGRGGTPFVTAGGAAMGVKGGRYLRYQSTVGDPLDEPKTEHNRLLVSIAQLMGLNNVNTFGATDRGMGPLSGF